MRYYIKTVCEVLEVNRSNYRYWVKRDRRLSPEAAKLNCLVKEAHRLSNGSAGARTVADIVTKDDSNDISLSLYRAKRSSNASKHQLIVIWSISFILSVQYLGL